MPWADPPHPKGWLIPASQKSALCPHASRQDSPQHGNVDNQEGAAHPKHKAKPPSGWGTEPEPPQTQRGTCWPGEVPYLSDTAHSWSIHSSGATLWAQKAKLSLHSQLPNPPVPPTSPLIFCPSFPSSLTGNISKSSQLDFLVSTSNILDKEDKINLSPLCIPSQEDFSCPKNLPNTTQAVGCLPGLGCCTHQSGIGGFLQVSWGGEGLLLMMPRYSSTQEGCGTADTGIREGLMPPARHLKRSGKVQTAKPTNFWGVGKIKAGIAQVVHLNRTLRSW